MIVYHFEKEEVSAYGFDEIVRAGIYEDLEIDFAEIGRLIGETSNSRSLF